MNGIEKPACRASDLRHIVPQYPSGILGNSGLPIVEALNHHPKTDV
jgi:hypothetical protein